MGTPVEGGNSEISYEPTAVQDNGPDQSNIPGPNPAWNDVLGILPEQFHSVVTPHFQKWDQAANSRIESLNSQYEPYKVFAEHGISSEDIQQGLRLAQAINDNPQGVYQALAEAYNFGQQQEVQQEEESDEASQIQLPPGYEQIQKSVEIMAQMELQRQQQNQQAKEDAELDNAIKAAQQKLNFGPETGYVEAQVNPYIAAALDAGGTVEQGIQSFIDMRNSFLNQRQAASAPRIFGNNSGQGAGLPSQVIDVTKLSPKETREAVAELARRMSQG